MLTIFSHDHEPTHYYLFTTLTDADDVCPTLRASSAGPLCDTLFHFPFRVLVLAQVGSRSRYHEGKKSGDRHQGGVTRCYVPA
jgi:hypothetical protein